MVFHKDKAGHWLPILPPGDPDMPRAKPVVSVMDLQKTKKQELPGEVSGDVADAKIVNNEAGIMPLSDSVQSVEGRALLENVDNTDDDSNIVRRENGAKEIHDDEKPNGQVTQGIK